MESLNSTCVQQFWNASTFAALNTTSFNITSTCRLSHNDSGPNGLTQFLIALSVILFLVSLSLAAVGWQQHAVLIRKLRFMPAYEVHEMIEERYAQTLKGLEWDLYKSNWKGRYLDIKWKDDKVEKNRTTVVVEDLRKIPPLDYDYETDRRRKEYKGSASLVRNCEGIEGSVADPSPVPPRQTSASTRTGSVANSLPGVDADVPPPSYVQEPRRTSARSNLLLASPVWEALRE